MMRPSQGKHAPVVDAMDVSTAPTYKHGQSCETGRQRRRGSGMGVPRSLYKMRTCPIGYWDGLGAHNVVNIQDSADVVEITYDREDKPPSNIGIGEDTLADEMGVEPFAVWNGSIGLITLKETLDTTTLDASEVGVVDTSASSETTGVPHLHKRFTLGSRTHTEIGTDHVEDQI